MYHLLRDSCAWDSKTVTLKLQCWHLHLLQTKKIVMIDDCIKMCIVGYIQQTHKTYTIVALLPPLALMSRSGSFVQTTQSCFAVWCCAWMSSSMSLMASNMSSPELYWVHATLEKRPICGMACSRSLSFFVSLVLGRLNVGFVAGVVSTDVWEHDDWTFRVFSMCMCEDWTFRVFSVCMCEDAVMLLASWLAVACMFWHFVCSGAWGVSVSFESVCSCSPMLVNCVRCSNKAWKIALDCCANSHCSQVPNKPDSLSISAAVLSPALLLWGDACMSNEGLSGMLLLPCLPVLGSMMVCEWLEVLLCFFLLTGFTRCPGLKWFTISFKVAPYGGVHSGGGT